MAGWVVGVGRLAEAFPGAGRVALAFPVDGRVAGVVVLLTFCLPVVACP